MPIKETPPDFGYFGPIFLPLIILIIVPVGIYFLYLRVTQSRRMFVMLCMLFLMVSLLKGYLKTSYLVPKPEIPLRKAYDYLFFDKKWPREYEMKRRVYIQSVALHPKVYYVHDFILSPLWYALLLSLIPFGIFTFFGNFILGFKKILYNRKVSLDPISLNDRQDLTSHEPSG
ncbi:MAG TPA: hypothetical protein VNM22_22585 [Candidatus Limnocylindrales bacterium]|nr:hypothetical protein [Candidatus Limnocylindrales bacterium]